MNTVFSAPLRRWLLRLAAFLLALCVPFLLLLGCIGFVPETSQQSLLYTLHYKLDLLRDTPGDRILIAGGSASEYGVVCETVEQATGRPTLCAGVTAYLGVGMYLNMLDRYAREGDTVILMLEHLMLRGTGVDYMVLWQACGTDPDGIWPSASRPGGTRCTAACAGPATITRPARRRTATTLARAAM